MKGIVFTEFLEMVESKFGYELVDELITQNELPSKGIYTAIGTYEASEMFTLVGSLHAKTKVPVPDLLKAFGHYLFGTFQKNYGAFFERAEDAFQFLESIEHYIHVEVRKLYPDAELPSFETKRIDEQTLEMIYTSQRRMGDFALGLIEKTFEHYHEQAEISKENVDEHGSIVKFTLTKIDGAG